MTASALQLPLDVAVETLERLGIRYALVGGLAVGVWGALRATDDIDLYAEIVPAIRPRLRNELARREFHVPAMEEELQQFGVFRSLFRPTNVFLDIFDSQTPLGEAILDRRCSMPVEGAARWVAAAEDIAVLKAFSDREQDHQDLMKLIAVGGSKLDMAYIEKWVRELDRSIGGNDVSVRLEHARREAARRVGPNAPQRRR